MGDVDDKTSQFVSVTGADADTAAFYLESCNGNLQTAIDSYFSGDASTPAPAPATTDPDRFLPPRPNVQAPSDPSGGGDAGTGGGNGQGAGQGGTTRPSSIRKTNIRGFSDLGKDEDEDNDEEDNEYYAGGEKSGVAVKGGGKKERVEGLFDSARKHGAVEGTERDLNPSSEGMKAFSGSARTLAGGVTDAEPQDVRSEPVAHTITFYEDEIFVVDDGDPREISDPANASFLESLNRGECPRELEPKDGRPVNVNLVRKEVKYTPPEKPKYVAFSGAGQSLAGGASASGAGAGSTSAAGTGIVPGAEWAGPDESQPTTSIQIRMHDGSRMVAQFNHNHTVLDIRRFIAAARPEMGVTYSLLTAFPSANLTDDSATIEGAGLLNAVIIQKL
ncbi:hypothetical protein BSKO_11880 [Bryopsis sp. KO-2023]|nr:hypothetical protein BSKO_11880 [Bryopsis sp. KO-2023]